jgi:hypothetical protein
MPRVDPPNRDGNHRVAEETVVVVDASVADANRLPFAMQPARPHVGPSRSAVLRHLGCEKVEEFDAPPALDPKHLRASHPSFSLSTQT